jgi:HSP20 family protein
MRLIASRPGTFSGNLLGLGRLDRALDDVFGLWPFSREFNGTAPSAWIPACEVREDKDGLTIALELPGVKPEDVKLSLENQTLSIRGEKKQVAEQSDETVYRTERSYGSFERAFSLPNTVDVERVKAAFENGTLTVTLPKVERARPREIPVSVK